ncbi:hypothetical protein BH11GEM1_BH11GEM1_35450 [soil metagenome]
MPSLSRRRSFVAVVMLSFVIAGCASAPRAAEPAMRTAERLDDSTFWRMMNEYSEPWGVFRSENLVSNETSLQWVIPELQRTVPAGRVYVGVAPDQNFTYIAALKPRIAFIVDIRHQNAVQHLLYKSLFEMSGNRAEFLATLFSRPPLTGVAQHSTAQELFDALANTRADSVRYRDNLRRITDRLVRVHHFALSDSEVVSLNCVYRAFLTQGPALTYNYGSECRNPGQLGFRGGGGGFNGGGFGGMPSFLEMSQESDSAGGNFGYLASDEAFRQVKDFEERNLIVPITGNFAGDRSLRAVGQWSRDHGALVGAFYVSNVEQYLFMQGDEAQRFYANVATLPTDASSTFIRSFSSGGRGGGPITKPLHQQSGRSMQLLSGVDALVQAYNAGKVRSWNDIVAHSHQ